MSTWATTTDVIDRWVGDNPPTDTDQIQLLLDDAEAVILSEYPSIQSRINTGEISAGIVKLVVTRMVIRLMRNPENLSSWQQMAGPFQQGRSFGAERDIWLTSDEMKMLAPNTKGKAFQIDLAPNAVDPTFEDYIWVEKHVF
jgi:hypothetical protein